MMFPRLNSFPSAALVAVGLVWVTAEVFSQNPASGGGPKTVRELILELGQVPGKSEQLKLKLDGVTQPEDDGQKPTTTKYELLYDRGRGQILLTSDSVFPDTSRGRITRLAFDSRAVIWTERWQLGMPKDADPAITVRPIKTSHLLPNTWRLPVPLGMAALFADSIHGYQALAREHAISRVLNAEPDADGLIWIDLRASSGASKGLRAEFDRGLTVKAGFAGKDGWLERLVIGYPKPEATLTMQVTERKLKLSESDLARFEVPEAIENWKPPVPIAGSAPPEATVGPLKKLRREKKVNKKRISVEQPSK